MSDVPALADETFRDYVVANTPSSGAYEPPKADVREIYRTIGEELDAVAPGAAEAAASAVAAAAAAEAAAATAATGYLSFTTTSTMNAFLSAGTNQTAYNAETDSYYRWSGSAWVFVRAAEVTRIAALEDAFTEVVSGTDIVGNPLAVFKDEDDNILQSFNRDGTVGVLLDQPSIDHVAALLPNATGDVPEALFAEAVTARPALAFLQSTDEEGFPASYVYRLDVVPPIVAVAVCRLPAELCGSDGQSLNIDGGDAGAEIITSPPYPHRALTLNGSTTGGPIFAGLTALDGSATTDLQPCYEAAGQNKDSPVTGMLRMMVALDLADALEPPVRVGWASGAGGRNIAELVKGTTLYDNDMLVTRKAAELLRTYGYDAVVCYAQALDQGEEDRSDSVSVSSWVTTYATYRSDKEADIRAITRQVEPVWHHLKALAGAPGTGGVGQPFIGIAHYQAMTTLPRTTISHCDYFLKGTYGLGNAGVHATSLGQDLRGEYRGKTARRITQLIQAAIAAGTDPNGVTYRDVASCLAVVGATRVGTTVTLDLMMPWDSTSVVEDTSTLPAATTTGIVKGIKASAGVATVTAVAVTNPSAGVYKLAVTLSLAVAGTLRGGADPVDTSTTDRSNAWTNFKAPSSIDSIAVAGLKLDNWLVPFEISYA